MTKKQFLISTSALLIFIFAVIAVNTSKSLYCSIPSNLFSKYVNCVKFVKAGENGLLKGAMSEEETIEFFESRLTKEEFIAWKKKFIRRLNSPYKPQLNSITYEHYSCGTREHPFMRGECAKAWVDLDRKRAQMNINEMNVE